MVCVISIRACPDPNDFYDELIPEGGVDVQGWRLHIQRILTPTTLADQSESMVDVRWLYAEFNCETERIKETLELQRPRLDQILRILAGIRKEYFAGGVRFSMYFEEYVNNGVRGNICPAHIPLDIDVQNVKVTDSAGNTLFDAKAIEEGKAKRDRLAVKGELRSGASRHLKLMCDPYFRRAWESYSFALGSDEHSLGHLFAIREAASERFPDARKILGISKDEWSKFGLLFNNNPILGGRHNGKNPGALRPITGREKADSLKFAKKLLDAFAQQLELEASGHI